MYIPRAPGSGDVIFAGATAADRAATEEAFWKVVNSEGSGGYAGKTTVSETAVFSPWTNNIDVASARKPDVLQRATRRFNFDILNFGNLVNKRWGRIDEMGFQSGGGQIRSFVNFVGIRLPRRASTFYSVRSPDDFTTRQLRGESQWAMQATIRYEF